MSLNPCHEKFLRVGVRRKKPMKRTARKTVSETAESA